MGFIARMPNPRARRPPRAVANTWISHFTHAEWRRLPLSIRMRWWDETDFSEREPSAELVDAVKAALAAAEARP
jgi:hypothetical protein